MTDEEKRLLLVDLSARLSYGVKVHCEWNLFQGDRISEDGELVSINTLTNSVHFRRNSGRITEIPFNRIDGTVLPYLRPMYSMTEEELKEFRSFHCVYDLHPYFHPMMCNIPNLTNMFNWLNSHHLDYCGWIKKGLALEAPDDMYNMNE